MEPQARTSLIISRATLSIFFLNCSGWCEVSGGGRGAWNKTSCGRDAEVHCWACCACRQLAGASVPSLCLAQPGQRCCSMMQTG